MALGSAAGHSVAGLPAACLSLNPFHESSSKLNASAILFKVGFCGHSSGWTDGGYFPIIIRPTVVLEWLKVGGGLVPWEEDGQ